ncbi:hypothetical protein [Fructobacillus durionis]|uniref:Prophage Lp1 protein 6 n=1 Tax=Fructobacillus durionis TaxID=283737 RepID=A0A1I1FJM2_9LACO|nr:hypothetical protein [Fructobacillus durionis]SFB99699.1 hypothetical protein SAMN05660453_0791 [Fructobacillus durionis]
MKLKDLAVANGIVGLAGGIVLLFGVFMVAGAATSDILIGGDSISPMVIILGCLKVAILTLGIIGLTEFNKNPIITKSPSVLLIVGGAIALVPLLGWVGGIISIVGGSMYLANLKKFDDAK